MYKQFSFVLVLFAVIYQAAFAKAATPAEDPEITHKVYFDMKHGDKDVGRIVFGLFGTVAPKTVENFYQLSISDDPKMGYINSTSHRIIKDFMIQMGDFTHGSGVGGKSIYGNTFEDESFELKHNKKGRLSMANRGLGTNGSQFFITVNDDLHWLNGKHVVFGQVIEGYDDVVDYLQNVDTTRNDKPKLPVVIVACGDYKDVEPATAETAEKATPEAVAQDEDIKHDEL
mgnify:FL=1